MASDVQQDAHFWFRCLDLAAEVRRTKASTNKIEVDTNMVLTVADLIQDGDEDGEAEAAEGHGEDEGGA